MPHKYNILLDLDQTLISAEPVEEYDFNANKTKSKKFNFYNMDNYYIVFERPGLQKFLDFLFANFNVSIWTAASKDYALFIIKKIILAGKKTRKIDWIFFSYHCDLSKKKKKNTKKLEMLWDEYDLSGYEKQNTFIIDDYDEVHNSQPNNCIVAIPFNFTNENSDKDNYLKVLMKELSDLKNDKSKSISKINNNIKTKVKPITVD